MKLRFLLYWSQVINTDVSFLRRTQDMSERSEESHPLVLGKLLVKQVEWDSSPAAQNDNLQTVCVSYV
jgi:hypothetical protein